MTIKRVMGNLDGKIIFFTDLHHGGDMLARRVGDISILGKQWGLPLLRAMVSYGKQEGNSVLVHGGDEVTFKKPNIWRPTKNQLIEARRKHNSNACDVRDLMSYSDIYVARTIGNHDDTFHRDQLLFNRLTHIFHQSAVPNTDLVICQPEVSTKNTTPTFAYNPDHIISVLEECTNPNLILSSHWAFDRDGLPGNGYIYTDNTAKIKKHLTDKLKNRTLNSVLTMHGHSHRFRRNSDSGPTIITMPSIVQNDIDIKDNPCGVFMEVGIDKITGTLTPTFHRMRLSDRHGRNFQAKEISFNGIMRFKR